MEKILKANKKITILGTIKGSTDINQIKNTIIEYELKESNSFTIDIADSFSMPSTMIDYLVELVKQENINLTLHVGDERLANLLHELGLSKTLNIKTKSFA